MANRNLHAPHTSRQYGKRPLWQWMLIYIIFAAIVYGFIYYFFSGSNLIDHYNY